MRYQFAAMLAVSGLQIVVPAAARAEDGKPLERQNADIIVTGAKAQKTKLNESASATGLDLTLRETPQSVSVIDHQRIEDFALTNITDVLD